MKDFLIFINHCLMFILVLIILMFIYNLIVQDSITKIQNIKVL